jgi:hypothetical protein
MISNNFPSDVLIATVPPLHPGWQFVACCLGYTLTASLRLRLAGRLSLIACVAGLSTAFAAFGGFSLFGLLDPRGIGAFILGVSGGILSSWGTFHRPFSISWDRSTVWHTVVSITVGLVVGFCLYVLWYWQADLGDLGEVTWYFWMFIALGAFSGLVAAVVVTLLGFRITGLGQSPNESTGRDKD